MIRIYQRNNHLLERSLLRCLIRANIYLPQNPKKLRQQTSTISHPERLARKSTREKSHKLIVLPIPTTLPAPRRPIPIQSNRSLKPPGPRLQTRHLHPTPTPLLLLRQRCRFPPLPLPKPLIPLLIPPLKPQIRRRPRPHQDNQEVPPERFLLERSVPVLHGEFC